nr:hypothetical protein [Tanacetum cinerariifolium]
ETSIINALVSQCDGIKSYNWSYQAEEEPANFALMAISSSSSASDNEGTSCQLNLTWPSALIIEDWVFDSKDESETKIPHIIPSFVQPTEQVKSPRLSVQHVEISIPTANPKIAISKLTTVITKSKLVLINAARPVTAAVPKPHVTRPRPAKPIVTKPHSPPRRNINRSPSPKANDFPLKVTAVKVLQVNIAKGVQGKWEWNPKCPILEYVSHNTSASMTLKRFDYNDSLGRSKSDKGVIDSGCSRHMTWNMSYMSDFEELNSGYVAFGGNPNGGKISSK